MKSSTNQNCKNMEGLSKTQVRTLEQLARYINGRDDWPLEVSGIIISNGWKDETGVPYGVCSDGMAKVVLDERGVAQVIEIV